jgi:hypothetical protein
LGRIVTPQETNHPPYAKSYKLKIKWWIYKNN